MLILLINTASSFSIGCQVLCMHETTQCQVDSCKATCAPSHSIFTKIFARTGGVAFAPANPICHLSICGRAAYPRSISGDMTRGQPPQDQIFFLLNGGFIRQIRRSSDFEPCVIEIYPCVNSVASQTSPGRCMAATADYWANIMGNECRSGGSTPSTSPGLTFPSKASRSHAGSLPPSLPRALLPQLGPRRAFGLFFLSFLFLFFSERIEVEQRQKRNDAVCELALPFLAPFSKRSNDVIHLRAAA